MNRECYRDVGNGVLIADVHYLGGAVGKISIGSSHFLGQVVYPCVVEVYTRAVLVVGGCELLAV